MSLCIKRHFLGVCEKILLLCAEKFACFGVRAEILLTRDNVFLESRAGLFLGFVENFFVEKYALLNLTLLTPLCGTFGPRNLFDC